MWPTALFLSLCCRKERNKENGTFANRSARKRSYAACCCGWLYRSSQAQPALLALWLLKFYVVSRLLLMEFIEKWKFFFVCGSFVVGVLVVMPCRCGFEGVLTNFQKLPLSSTIFRLLPLFLPLFSPEIGLHVLWVIPGFVNMFGK